MVCGHFGPGVSKIGLTVTWTGSIPDRISLAAESKRLMSVQGSVFPSCTRLAICYNAAHSARGLDSSRGLDLSNPTRGFVEFQQHRAISSVG
jgi:hypothetical protein